FIVLCGVFGYLYLGKDRGEDRAKQKTEEKVREAKSAQSTKTQAARPIEIELFTSSAKKTWIERAITAFHAQHPAVDGKEVRVRVYHVLSGDSMEDLKAGKIQPDIWSPGDESWLIMASDYWKEVKGKPLYDSYHPLINVPLVIAMWEPMARALGYPKLIGWSDIVKLARDPKGWGSVGHPEWGKFRWGHAHPDANSGFLAVLSLVYAAAGKTSGLSPDDLKRPEVVAFLKDAESSVEHYGLSNDFIDQLMHSRGPAYLSCAVQYENTIIESNEKHGNQPFRLVAVYPKEGAVWTQHPAVVIKESWMTLEKEKACSMFLEFLLSDRAQGLAIQCGLRPISRSVNVASPFDQNHGVMESPPSIPMLAVPSQSVLQRIRDLWEEVKLPATIG
ncbi:MAG: extracellular solute-binding protein, partial [Deltaproteobacteria bacterium]|nr:extracellular solute-binding protein [Deltaproteobacteria bacterium]